MSIEATGLGSGGLQGIWPHKGRGVTSRVANMMLKEMDADADGKLSQTESGLSETAFKGLDTDEDGSVSRKELKAGLRSRRDQLMSMLEQGPDEGDDSTAQQTGQTGQTGQAGQVGAAAGLVKNILSKRDADADGTLSEEEAGLSSTTFDSFDTNQDGVLSAEELAAGFDKMFETMRALRDMMGNEEHAGPGAMQRAVAAYKGQMSGLMKGLFETETDSAGAETSGTAPDTAATGTAATGTVATDTATTGTGTAGTTTAGTGTTESTTSGISATV